TTRVQTNLHAADYVALDAVRSNPPHTTFTIAKSANPASLPKPDASVRAIEFGFRGASTLHRGTLVRFENGGFVVHMIVGVQARNDTDAHRLARALKNGNDAAARRLAIGFASFMNPASHGAVQQEVLRASAGAWVLACFMDTQ